RKERRNRPASHRAAGGGGFRRQARADRRSATFLDRSLFFPQIKFEGAAVDRHRQDIAAGFIHLRHRNRQLPTEPAHKRNEELLFESVDDRGMKGRVSARHVDSGRKGRVRRRWWLGRAWRRRRIRPLLHVHAALLLSGTAN